MNCELCGERFGPNDERAEMFDPELMIQIEMGNVTDDEAESVSCHAQCGLSRGYEVA
jgi:hypothetical protein